MGPTPICAACWTGGWTMAKKPKRHELFSHEARVAGGRRRAGNPRPILPQRHLFVTEGTKTEPNYLNGMIDQICTCYGASCRKQFVVYGEGDNTLGLLTKAEKHLINEPDGFQHVWILYDQDDFPKDRFDNAEQCFSDAHVAGKNRFHVLPSSADDGTLRGSCTRSDAFALFRQVRFLTLFFPLQNWAGKSPDALPAGPLPPGSPGPQRRAGL